MRNPLRFFAAKLLSSTPLGLCPVRVRSGMAAGARWTLYPWTSYWRGTYEPTVQAAMLALGGGDIRGWNCWDLGAHFGLYSIGLARRVGPSGQVAAFEPNPRSFARLQHHAHLNRLPWLRLYQAAASENAGDAELYTYGNLDTTTTHLPYDGETRPARLGVLAVTALRLDALVERGELRAPHFIKIDVEGHGHCALRGMQQTLHHARPTILVGLHSAQEVGGVLSLLAPLGYRPQAVEPSTSSAPESGSDYLFVPTR